MAASRTNLQNVTESLTGDFNNWLDDVWEHRDKRVDGWPMLNSFWPTFILVAAYLFIVKIWGPRFMQNRPAYNITKFLIIYNAFQVILSAYIFIQLLRAGWGGDYSFRCQPVDQSQSPQAQLMLHACYIYYLSKFSEFIDTFCFVARKKFNQVSTLHVIHHGIMPMSVWPGARFLPGGHSSFFSLFNVSVHIVMYFYYMLAAFGPQYQKYLWWKQYLTTLQIVQFVAIMTHGLQLFFLDDCGFPKAFGYYIAAHAILFFGLFSQFYIKTYLNRNKRPKVEDANANFQESGKGDHLKSS